MEGAEYMYAAVEAGVALAGFSALVIALRQTDGKSMAATERLVVLSLVERGLMAAFLALLPILLAGLELSAKLVWFICSGTLFLYGVTVFIRAIRSRKRIGGLVRSSLFYALMSIGVLVILLQLANALGIVIAQGAWWYLIGITWLLATAGYRFLFVLQGWIQDG